MKQTTIAIATLVLLALVAAPAHAAPRDRAILDTLTSELARAKSGLKLEEFDPPYFISYTLKVQEQHIIKGSSGGIYYSSPSSSSDLAVQVRIGSYEFDNTNPEEPDLFPPYPYGDEFERVWALLHAPLGSDEASLFALRRRLWLLSDIIYKQALSEYMDKKAKKVRILQTEQIPNFSREEPQVYIEPQGSFDFKPSLWERVVRDEGLYLASFPEIRKNDISVKATRIRRYFVNTEGTRIADSHELFVFHAQVQALADDGMPVENFFTRYSRSLDDLPTPKEIHRGIEEMVKETLALIKAPTIEPYTGPALLDASVCAVFFHEAIGHRLEGERQRSHEEGQTFAKKLGERIVPEFISVIDDPTLRRWENGDYLNGYYLYDDEGVKAQRVVLVEDGILKGFLLSRTPIKGFLHSNGHGRAASYLKPVARMANTIVLSKKQRPWDELKQMLIEMAKEKGKPFGLIIKKARWGETYTRRRWIQAFRNHPILIY
ncbi:MAG TPA: TldD/PmbA family protein, partial [Proteobacteria bacterium]|nr:TldD/PmbA family protein [Pseudomonadota bacterium]